MAEIRRGPERVDRFEQELLVDAPDHKISLQVVGPELAPVRIDPNTTLRSGALLVWYVWPGEPYEIGAFHDPADTFLGHYVNIIRPPAIEPGRWRIDDLFVDVWVPAEGEPVLLDADELEEAHEQGWLTDEDAERARRVASELLERARGGDWPPSLLRRWTPDLVPALRRRRDHPGTFYAARLSGRIIAYGLYLMGAVSATSVAFAAFTGAFSGSDAAQRVWAWTLLGEAVVLLPLALGGKLPATFWPRPALVDERSLFVATLASGLAVLGLNERAEWTGALLPVYAVLGLFSTIFAVCRIRFDRQIPAFALAGVLVTLTALWILL